MQKRVLVVDVDDTLYPERDFVISALRAAGARAAVLTRQDGFGEAAVRLFEAGRRGDIFQAAWQELRTEPLGPEHVAELVRVYREHRPERLEWFPDATAFVEEHLASGGLLAAITDGFLPTQRLKVEALGLDKLARPVVISEELGRDAWKPSPRPYAAVEAAFPAGTKFGYVADNPLKDFLAARARGWLTIRVKRPGTEHFSKAAPSLAHEPDAVVADFHGVRKLWTDDFK
jgi:putative hydrolase of the HAD superfamily